MATARGAKGQHRASSPDLDVTLQRAYLRIGELAGVTLLQLVEYRSAGAFRLDHQPLADLVPHGFERILASTVGTRPLELLAPTILPSLTRAGWQSDSVADHPVTILATRFEIKVHRQRCAAGWADTAAEERVLPECLL